MKLLEYQGKALLARAGLALPDGRMVTAAAEAGAVAAELGGEVVVKAQLFKPGRGKRGAIRFAGSPEEATAAAGALLGAEFDGEVATRLLVERKLAIARELYASCVVDNEARRTLVILSAAGGADIEEVFRTAPQSIVQYRYRPFEPLHPFLGRRLAREMGLGGKAIIRVGQAIVALIAASRRFQARILEVNPLVLTADGEVVVADAVMNIDEDGMFRVPELGELGIEMEEERPRPPTEREIAAQEIDQQDYRGVVHYQDLDPEGDVGVVSVGSGFSLTLQDMLAHYGLRAFDFCDCSGSPPAGKVEASVKLVFSNPKLRGFLFMSGVVTQDLTVTAEGIIAAHRALEPKVPFLVRLAGNRDHQAYAMLRDAGIQAYQRQDPVETCIEDLKRLMAQAPAATGGGGA